MNELRGTTRRVCRILPDDPRIAACTLWLRTCTLTPETQEKLRDAITSIIEESGEFATHEIVQEDEVREPGVAEEVPSGQVREAPMNVWKLWRDHYGLAGARRLAVSSGWEPRE